MRLSRYRNPLHCFDGLFLHENYHAVPVVSVVRLSVATFASYIEAVAFDAVFVDEIGKGRIEKISSEDFSKLIERSLKA